MSTQLQLPLFKTINESRSTYGLRHQDYTRYKSHCTRKVAHLRKAAGLTQVSGKNKKYTKKEVTESNLKSDKTLLILLFDAERSWAHSQEIKSTLSHPNVPPSKKHDVTRRLSRAVLAASKLLSFVSHLSPTEHGQVVAYYLIMKGSLAFEHQRHEEGLKVLSVANELLGVLAKTAKSAQEEALVNEMIDEVEPMARFCAYSLDYDTSKGIGLISEEVVKGVDKDNLVEGYGELIASLKKVESEGSQGEKERVSITFRGKDVPVRNSQLVQVVMKVQSAVKSLEATSEEVKRKNKKGKNNAMGLRKMNAFDKALLVMGEAEDVASQLVEDNKIALSSTNSSRYETSSSPLILLHSYLSYTLLSTRIARDLLLVQTSLQTLSSRLSKIAQVEKEYIIANGTRDPKVREEKERKSEAKVLPGVVRLFDGVVASLESVRELSVVEDDGELGAEVEGRIAVARAQRCFYLSKAYALLSRYSDSLSLNARAKLYNREARSIASSLSSPLAIEDDLASEIIGTELSLTEAAFDTLDKELERDQKRISGDWFVASDGKFGEDEDEVVMMDELDLSEKKEKKEKFYDVAFNYVTAFDLEGIQKMAGLGETYEDAQDEEVEEEEEEVEQKQEQGQKKGWGFGLFGRK